MKKREL